MSWTMIMFVLSAVALFWAGVAALTAFAVQLAILNLTERRFQFLRWALLVAAAPALCCAGLTESVIWLGAAGTLLLGWGLGWAVYKLQKGREKREKTDPDL